MARTRSALALAALTLTLLLGACGSSGSDGGSGGGTAGETASTADPGATDQDVDDALEGALPTDTVEVPSEDGATPISDWVAGGSDYEPADSTELGTVLAIVGTDVDGYLTEDAIVVRAEAADASLWCATLERLDISTYRLVPVLPDGTGVACG